MKSPVDNSVWNQTKIGVSFIAIALLSKHLHLYFLSITSLKRKVLDKCECEGTEPRVAGHQSVTERLLTLNFLLGRTRWFHEYTQLTGLFLSAVLHNIHICRIDNVYYEVSFIHRFLIFCWTGSRDWTKLVSFHLKGPVLLMPPRLQGDGQSFMNSRVIDAERLYLTQR